MRHLHTVVICAGLSALLVALAGCASAEVKATRTGDVRELSEYIAKGGDVNAPQRGGGSLLMIAASAGQVESARLLLDSGANIEMRDSQGRTALMYATSAGQVVVVQLLLERGAKIDARDNSGATSLILASGAGQLPSVQLLLEKRAALDVMTNGGYTALLTALDRSAQQPAQVNAVARLLADRGAPLDPASEAATQVAFRAAGSGNIEVLMLLLDRGLDPEARDRAGTPLLLAAAGNDRLVALLVDEGASASARNAAGETVLMAAAGKGSLESVGFLLERGADPNAVASSGQTALLAAAARPNVEVVRQLLLRGANPRVVDRAGNSPLHVAARASDADTVRLLVTAGINVNASNGAGETPIVLARRNPQADAITRILVAGGAFVPIAQTPPPPTGPAIAPPSPSAPAGHQPPGATKPGVGPGQGAGPQAGPAAPAAPAAPAPAAPAAVTPVPGVASIVDTGAAQVRVKVSWPRINPSNVDGWTPSDPLRAVATIRMRAYRQAEWFLTHDVAIPTRQSGVDAFEQSYDLRVDASRMIECQVSILTAAGRSVNATIVARVAGPALDFTFADFRFSDAPDVAWPALGTQVAFGFRYSLPAIPAGVKRQLQAAGDAVTRKKQARGADRAELLLTVFDSTGKQLAADKQVYDPDAPIQGTVVAAGRLPEGSTVRYVFEVSTARGKLTAEGQAPVYSVYSHATKARPAAEALAAPSAESWTYRGR